MISFGYDHLVGRLLVCAMFVEHLVRAKCMGLLFLVESFKNNPPRAALLFKKMWVFFLNDVAAKYFW